MSEIIVKLPHALPCSGVSTATTSVSTDTMRSGSRSPVPRIHFLNTNKLNYNFSFLLWSDLLPVLVDVDKSTGLEEREGWAISLF
jgi:hypothetical protein